MAGNRQQVIITAASAAYERALFGLLGSMNVNWPGHPPVVVFDLGMGDQTLSFLSEMGVEVRPVSKFCTHWRKHFAWKIWCMSQVKSGGFFWLDAGVCVLRPLDEIQVAIEKLGYFCSTNYWRLTSNMNKPLQIALNLSDDQLKGMVSINAGVFGLRVDEIGRRFLQDAFEIACQERCMAATEPLHRHDQPLLSALLERYYSPVLYADFRTYAGWKSPSETPNQKIWVHRRRMAESDIAYFKAHVSLQGAPRIPIYQHDDKPPSKIKKLRMAVAKFRGRLPAEDRAGTVIYDGVRD